MRASVVVTIVAMGVLSFVMAAVSGRIYRDHAVDNERAALSERARVGVEAMRQRLSTEAEGIARVLQSQLTGRSAAGGRDYALRTLDKELGHYTASEHDFSPIEIALYDRELRTLGRRQRFSTELPAGDLQAGCAYLRTPSDAARVSPSSTSGYCFVGSRVYYGVFLGLTSSFASYVQVTFDAASNARVLEALVGLPVRLVSDDLVIYQSANWPSSESVGHTLAASLTVDTTGSKALLFQVAKDESAFYARLEQTRYAVFFAATAVTLLFILVALAFLERMAVGPVRALLDQLRGVRGDESQLGNRVRVGGNAESVQIAESFNAVTDKLERLYEQLDRMTYTDLLTQLPNRSFFQSRLEQAIVQAQHDNRTFALFIMDLDRFKEINDTLGHHIGDVLLQQVAIRLRDKLRESDTIARMGGDEFAVLLPTVTAKQADMAARMLVQSLRSPFVVQSHQLDVGVSIGIALYPDHGVDAHTLIQRAEVAMYSAKQGGCGQVFYDPQMDRHHPAQLTLMGELRQAVEQEQFVLYYQPKIGLRTNRVVGVEALVRWCHPSGSLVMPDTFISLLEQTGLIRGLTSWVTHEALRMASELRSQGFELPIAVNISARDLQNNGLAEELAEQLAAHQAAAEWLELEITESAVMSDIAGAHDLLTELADMGFKVVIDDFGTGYSSLAYLKRLPVHAVKIDKSFVMGMARDENDAAIVYTSIDLSHNLGLQVVAEGVDDEGVLMRLRSRGCDAVQGMYLSRPLSSEELTSWLAKSIWGFPTRVAC